MTHTSTSPLGVLLDLVLPRPCPGCGGPEPWCAACAGTLRVRPRLVRLPEATLDAAAATVVPPARALVRYSGPARAAILAGKERGRRDLPALLGEAVGHALIRQRRMSLIPDDIWLVPAPSRRSAARIRGGDPVTAMARAAVRVASVRGLRGRVAPCLFTAERARDSVGLDARGRAANLAGRIRFRQRGRPSTAAPVVLLDDVLTTGSTVLASVAALSREGVDVVGVLAVATAAPWSSRR